MLRNWKEMLIVIQICMRNLAFTQLQLTSDARHLE